MGWVAERRRSSKRKAQTAAPGGVDGEELAQHIHDSCAKVKALDSKALKRELAGLERKARRMNKRWQFRERRALENQARAVREKIERRESGEEYEDHVERVAPYLQAAQSIKAPGCSSTEDSSSNNVCAASIEELIAALPPHKRARLEAARAKKRPCDAGDTSTSTKRRRLLGQAKAAKDSLRDEYMTRVEKRSAPLYVVRSDICTKCGTPMKIMGTEALLVCPCGRGRVYIQATSSRIAFGEEIEFAAFSYKRHNHFMEWLNGFQARESTEVPGDVLVSVMFEFFKRRVTDAGDITPKKVREVLKDLGLRKYYENKAQVAWKLSGRPPPRMTPQEEEQFKLMFDAIQQPFRVHCPPDRSNFLSYSYCLFKFSQLLGWDHFLPCFSLLKGRDKLQKQDAIWRKICEELDWDFIKST